jgi:hypothetical protein
MYQPKDPAEGKAIAEQVIASFPDCPTPEFARLGRNLRQWKTHLLASSTPTASATAAPKPSTAAEGRHKARRADLVPEGPGRELNAVVGVEDPARLRESVSNGHGECVYHQRGVLPRVDRPAHDPAG